MKLNFKKLNGLVPAIIQDWKTSKVLMVCFMNQEAWKKTLETKQTWYYSRTRRKLCKKGEVSGNVQKIKDILVDCDNDTVLLKVEQVGNAACHEGYNSCFFRRIDGKKIEKKVFNPSEVYSK